MASNLSYDEFERLQNQLLELKSVNYNLEDRSKKQISEISHWKSKSEALEKELTKFQNLAKLNPISFARNLTLKSSNKEKEIIEKLTAENENYQKRFENQESDFRTTNDALKKEVASLLEQQSALEQQIKDLKETYLEKPECDLISEEEMNKQQIKYSVIAEKEKLEAYVLQLKKDNERLIQEKDVLSDEIDSLNRKITDTEAFLDDYKTLTEKFQEVSSIAEKNVATIAELKEQLDRINTSHEIEIDNLSKLNEGLRLDLTRYEDENKRLANNLKDFRQLSDKMNNTKKCIGPLITSFKTIKSDIFRHRNEIINLYKEMRAFNETTIKNLIKTTNNHITKEKEKLNSILEEKKSLQNELETTMQQYLDGVEERKIHAKKGLMIIKDLNRHLNFERRRADKLQDKLNEILSEKSAISINIGANNDSSSVGSWSFMSNKDNSGLECNTSQYSEFDREMSPITSPDSEIANYSTLEQENAGLLNRVTKLQQEKWMLEERISHLETINSQLNEDVAKKKELISFYCMEGRPDPTPVSKDKITVKRVVDFIKDKGDENLKEINRKLQRMLEETLTKNMHLQQDLEIISKELEQLKK